jgi:RHS repeat-associated protein
MSRPSDWWVLDLDQDPTPGDSDRVTSLSKRFLDFADVADRARAAVTSLQGDDTVLTWIGKSGDAFREEFGNFPGQLRKLCDSHRMAGDALAAYAPRLSTAQAQADRALADGRLARDQLTSLTGQLDSAATASADSSRNADQLQHPQEGTVSPDPAQVQQAIRDARAAQDRRDAVQGQVNASQQALAAAKSMAEQARALRAEAEQECVKQIHEASDAGIKPRSFWDKLGEFCSHAWDGICEIAKWVALVAGVIALIIGGPLAWIAFGAGVILLVKAISDFAQGKGSLLELAFAALGAIPGVKGLTSLAELSALYKAGGLAAIGKAALMGLKNMVVGAAEAVRGLGSKAVTMAKTGINDLKNMFNELPHLTFKPREEIPTCGDPIDIATGRMILASTDLDLPGVLPLVLSRTHRSDYRAGRSFGLTWACTLDQRIEIEPEALHFAGGDGMLLTYPVPQGSRKVLPVLGAPMPLRGIETGGYVLVDHRAGRTLTFAPPEDGAALLESITARGGVTLRIVRDALGTPVEVRHDGGYTVAVDSDDELVTALRLLPGGEHPAGAAVEPVTVVEFRYDADRRLVEVINSSGLPLRFDYDAEGRITRWEDRNGMWYSYIYDEAGRCVVAEGRDGYLTYHFDYDVDHRVTRVTDSLGHVRIFELDERLQVTAETDPLGATTRSTWDMRGLLLSRTDPLGRSSHFTYDDRGDMVSLGYPDGTRTTVERDADGRPLAVTEPDGGVWRYTYRADGTLASVVNPLGQIRDLASTAPTTVTGPGRTPLLLIDEDGSATQIRYDAFGRTSEAIDPQGGQTSYRWSPEGRLLESKGPGAAGERWRYDPEGNILEHTDPQQRVTRFEYGAFDLVSARIDPDGARTEFRYDTELRCTEVVDPQGLRWNYEYDAAGRIRRSRDFDGRMREVEYDAAGQVAAARQGNGPTIQYRYDALGNLTFRDVQGVVSRFEHDQMGRTIRASGPDTEVILERDALGRVVAETVDGRRVAVTRDLRGRVTHRVTPAGMTSDWTFDAASRPLTLAAGAHTVRFGHDPLGLEIERELDGRVRLRQVFDPQSRLAGQDVVGVDPVTGECRDDDSALRRALRYAAGEDLVEVIDRASVVRYAMDAAGRVTTVDGTQRRERYRYDASGNLTTATVDPDIDVVAEAADSGGDRTYRGTLIQQAGRVRFAHDSAGRMIWRGAGDAAGDVGWSYRWSAEDRLVEVRTPGGDRWRCRYDAFGRRVCKQRWSPDGDRLVEQIEFSWFGDQLVEQVHHMPDGRRSVTTWDYHPEGGRAVLQRDAVDGRAPVAYLVVTNQVGAVSELVDTDARIAWQSNATVWGHEVDSAAAGAGSLAGLEQTSAAVTGYATTPLRLPGQYHDAETGLHYNRFRYYDPTLGRYLSQDPLGLSAGPNPVAYVLNPLRLIDPLGLMYCSGRPVRRVLPPGELDNQTTWARENVWRREIHPGDDYVGASYVDVDLGPGSFQPGGYGSTPDAMANTAVSDLRNLDPDRNWNWIKGHLWNDNLGGPGESWNLTAMTHDANMLYKTKVENLLKTAITFAHQTGEIKNLDFPWLGVRFRAEVLREVDSARAAVSPIADNIRITSEWITRPKFPDLPVTPENLEHFLDVIGQLPPLPNGNFDPWSGAWVPA